MTICQACDKMGPMSESTITTKELMRRAGISRHGIKILAAKLRIKPVGTKIGTTGVAQKLWPEDAVEKFSFAYRLIRRERKADRG